MNDKSITPRNDKLERHGFWQRYWYENIIDYKAFYQNGKQVGYDEDYNLKGTLNYKAFHLR